MVPVRNRMPVLEMMLEIGLQPGLESIDYPDKRVNNHSPKRMVEQLDRSARPSDFIFPINHYHFWFYPISGHTHFFFGWWISISDG